MMTKSPFNVFIGVSTSQKCEPFLEHLWTDIKIRYVLATFLHMANWIYKNCWVLSGVWHEKDSAGKKHSSDSSKDLIWKLTVRMISWKHHYLCGLARVKQLASVRYWGKNNSLFCSSSIIKVTRMWVQPRAVEGFFFNEKTHTIYPWCIQAFITRAPPPLHSV